MKMIRALANATSIAILLGVTAVPLTSNAHERAPMEGHPPNADMRAHWTKAEMEREANWLEIKASQQSAWDAYVAAHIDLMHALDNFQPLAPNVDAGAAMRQHAERTEAFAQSLATVADATEKLQSVLDDNQRKVLNRIVRMHSQFHHEHFAMPDGERACMPGHPHKPGQNSKDGNAKPDASSSKADNASH